MLEGVMVETDPEIPIHRLMPGAPIVQLICDGERLLSVSKNLFRSDADYFVIAEARDGIALDTAVRLAKRGQGRMKMTFHTRDPFSFPEDAAVEIVRSVGGDVRETAIRVADSFDYIFQFVSIRQKNAKKLKGIYEIGKISAGDSKYTNPCFTEKEYARGWYVREICSYDFALDEWTFTNHISEPKQIYGIENGESIFRDFSAELEKLAKIGRVK